MLKRRAFRLLPLFLLAAALPAQARAQDESLLTLERIYDSRDFASDFFGPARWMADGSGYTTVEISKSVRGLDIVKYDPATGAREVLVPAARMVPRGASAPLVAEDYAWSDDGGKLLVFTNTVRVWRTNTKGDYWVLDLAGGALTQMGADFPESTLMFAKFSPQGDRVAYVQANDIYVESLADGRITRLTQGGSPTLINGTFDWAYEEEFSLQDGFRWSPDGTKIAYWQIDASGVREFVLTNYTDSLYPQFTTIPYPKVGEVLSAARLGVVSAAGGETLWMDVPGDPRNNYIARMDWADGSDEVLLQHINRRQDENRVVLADARTGKVRTVFTDRDDAWVETVDDLLWLDGGKRFTWVSEKDGWRHVYAISRADGREQLLTPWPMDVMQVSLIDDAGGWLYFIASPDDAAQRYLYRSRLDGTGKAERLTPASAAGWNGYDVSPDGAWAFHTHSRMAVPTTWTLVRLPGHESVRVMADNADLKGRVAKLAKGELEFFRLERGDGPPLDGWMMKPPGFDPSKKYPVLFHVYGEPAGQTVVDRWGGSTYLWHLMLTQQGYIVASVDNRGSPAPRGREWRKSVYGAIGVLASADQAAANRELRKRPYVDGERIGIWGWSGGGSMTLNMMFRHPDLYATGMSVAPVPDQTLYDAIYQERYSGVLPDFAEGYRKGSPISFAEGLKGNLLLVHGTGDDNVHYQGSERLINRLVELNKQFTMFAYPNRSHGIFEGEGTTLHLRTLLTSYLRERLPAGPRLVGG
ncbi:MAG: S9 family peptidase [Longimicrobiales bacterium]|nr:S9 family peptidase [Longimicrobiales bacterium]